MIRVGLLRYIFQLSNPNSSVPYLILCAKQKRCKALQGNNSLFRVKIFSFFISEIMSSKEKSVTRPKLTFT